MINDTDLVKKAYKKLKSNVYYDKTMVILKKNLVEFENQYCDENKLDDELDKIQYKLMNSDDDEWNHYIKTYILDKIECILLPKKIKENKILNSTTPHIISNIDQNRDKVPIEKIQSFIHLPVVGHILGIVWLLTIGSQLDNDLTYCYGNRLSSKLYSSIKTCGEQRTINFSPYLFEPYYLQYESWRDKALEVAETHLHDDEDVVIVTGDFKNFYYSVDITEHFMEQILTKAVHEKEKTKNYAIARRLHQYIYDVIKKYSEQYKKYCNDNEERNILPIGFLPSNILANIKLNDFDKKIMSSFNPLYYGRYVDDIIIVDKINKTDSLYDKIRNNVVHKNLLCEYWAGKLSIDINEINKIEVKDIPQFILSLKNSDDKTNLKFNYEKCKMFYFDSGNQIELLKRFRKTIGENKSEFRFLPEDEIGFFDDEFTEIFDLEQHELNKLNDISGIRINKYKLSKLLARKQQILECIQLKDNDSYLNELDRVLTNSILIENYSLWERIITIISLCRDKELLIHMASKIESAIQKVSYEPELEKDNIGDIGKINKNLIESLRSFLFYDLCRVESALRLFRGPNDPSFNSYQKGIYFKRQYSKYENLIDKYENARMGDKYLYSTWFEIILQSKRIIDNDENHKNVSKKGSRISNLGYNYRWNFQSTLKLLSKTDRCWNDMKKKLSYKYYPYLVQTYDIYLSFLSYNMAHESTEIPFFIKNETTFYKDLFELFIKINYDPDVYLGNDFSGVGFNHQFIVKPIQQFCDRRKIPDCIQKNVFISIHNEKKSKIKISVSNIKINDNNLNDKFNGKNTCTNNHYKQVSRLVNDALKEKADILVMPECCLPFEWIPVLIHTCMKHDMAVITGVEHIVAGKRVYNLVATILPFKKDGIPCALPIFHFKTHFSPQELHVISDRQYIPMDAAALTNGERTYELYRWHDLYFSVYCCFELSSIVDRSLFQSYADAIFSVEWNRDIVYYQNILESLARDLHCYCIQANSSEYGDSRITQPSRHDNQDILRVKGGEASTILVGTIDVEKLRQFQCKGYVEQKKEKIFKPTPPLFDINIVRKKLRGEELFSS